MSGMNSYHVHNVGLSDKVPDSKRHTVADVDTPVINAERRASVFVFKIVGNQGRCKRSTASLTTSTTDVASEQNVQLHIHVSSFANAVNRYLRN